MWIVLTDCDKFSTSIQDPRTIWQFPFFRLSKPAWRSNNIVVIILLQISWLFSELSKPWNEIFFFKLLKIFRSAIILNLTKLQGIFFFYKLSISTNLPTTYVCELFYSDMG